MMNKTPMLLKKLEIEKQYYGENAGKFTGKASFSSNNATVYLNITSEITMKILDLCADALMDTAHDMSEVMRGDIIEAMSTEKRLK